MSVVSKVRTFAALLSDARFGTILERFRYNARLRALSKRASPFVFRYGRDRMVCDPSLHDSASMYLEKEADLQERDVMRAWLAPGDFVIDAGANVGLFTTVAAACVGASGTVIAIEPTPRLAAHLKKCAAMLGNASVVVQTGALGGQPGSAEFAFSAPECTTVSQSLVLGAVPPGTAEIRTVEVRTLSQVAACAKAQPSLIKLDIEGAEAQVLASAPESWLGAHGPLWIVECHPEALSRLGARPDQLFRAFPENDFDVWVIGKYAGGDGSDLPAVPLEPAKIPAASFYNLIAVPRGKLQGERRRRLAEVLAVAGSRKGHARRAA